MLQFASDKSSLCQGKVNAICSMCPDEPQVALAVIVGSANRGLDYLTRTTPTVHILSALKLFDKHLADTTLDLICPKAVTDKLPTCKIDIAKRLFQLPLRNNGLNLLPYADRAPPAYHLFWC